MTPIHRIAKNMAEDATLRKMTRTENAGWRKNIEAARMETGKDFKLGQWFCSTGAHESTVVHGPFDSSESAFNFSHENFGVVRFMSAPQWA